MFSMLLLIARGVQDDMARERISSKDKKHRPVFIPLCLEIDLSFIARFIRDLLFIIFAKDQGSQLRIEISNNLSVTFHKLALIGLFTCDDGPSAQYEWDGSICGDPFAVIFSCDMEVCSGGHSAFTGGVSDKVIQFNPFPLSHAVFRSNMQI